MSDEGTSSPFVARLLAGVLNLRDQLFLLGLPDAERESARVRFDKYYKPLYEAMEATRDSARRVRQLVLEHNNAIRTGRAVQFGANQYDILQSIDVPLSQAVDQLIDQGIIATKTALQSMLKDVLGLDIGFFFQRDAEFEAGIAQLRADGEHGLASYLEAARAGWHSALQHLRVQHEHRGWTLESVQYWLDGLTKVIPVFPTVLGMSVAEFAARTANRVLLFVENLLVFAMQRQCQLPILVIEVPREFREPTNMERFRLWPKGLDAPFDLWTIQYSDDIEFS